MSELSPQEIEVKVREILKRITGLDDHEINADDHFYQDLGIDSIKGIELAVGLQETFKIRLDDSKIPEMVTINLVVQEVVRLLENQS